MSTKTPVIKVGHFLIKIRQTMQNENKVIFWTMTLYRRG